MNNLKVDLNKTSFTKEDLLKIEKKGRIEGIAIGIVASLIVWTIGELIGIRKISMSKPSVKFGK